MGGLSSPTVVDVDNDGVADVAYAADYGGNMYRFDLCDPNPDNWTVEKLFAAGVQKPITAAPAVSKINQDQYVVIFGTGSAVCQSDLTNKDQQSIYGIYDDLTQSGNILVSADDLLQQKFTVSNGYRYLSNNNFDTNKYKGWYFDLPDNGERVVVKPSMILQTVAVTSRVYETQTSSSGSSNTDVDPCVSSTQTVTSSAYSWLLQFNARTGGGLTKNNARINLGDTVLSSGAYASGLKLSSLSAFTFVNASLRSSSVTRDGDSGGSGTEPELGNGNSLSNSCFTQQNNHVLGVSATGVSSYKVDGPSCGTLRCLSWRELTE